MSRQTDFHIANVVSAMSAAPDPKACTRIFRKAVAAFKIDAFACGEVDLTALDRTVFYAIAWPDSYRRFYFGTGLDRRDPLLDALKGRHEPLAWSELQRDRKKWSMIGTKALQVIAEHGWTDGLAVPIPRGNQRFGLVSLLARRRRTFDEDEKSGGHRHCGLPRHHRAVKTIALRGCRLDKGADAPVGSAFKLSQTPPSGGQFG